MSPASPSVSDRIRKQALSRKSEASSCCNHPCLAVPCPQGVLVQPDFECGMPIPESRHPSQKPAWHEIEQWWVSMARRLGVVERGQLFFKNALGQDGVLDRLGAASSWPRADVKERPGLLAGIRADSEERGCPLTRAQAAD